MIKPLFALISTLLSLFKDRRDLALEILALRQQLLVFKRLHPRPQLRPQDRLFWVWTLEDLGRLAPGFDHRQT